MFKTLLVEDNLNYRGVLKNALLKRFVELETKETSGEGDTLDIIDTYDPDLVIMDIGLKCDANGKCEVSGLDLTKTIKRDHPETVVVILTQHDIPEYRSVAQQNGADCFFSKSSSLESIFEYVDFVIEHSPEPHKKNTELETVD